MLFYLPNLTILTIFELDILIWSKISILYLERIVNSNRFRVSQMVAECKMKKAGGKNE